MLFNLGSKLVSGAVAAASVGIVGGGVTARMFSVSAQARENIYQFSAKDIDGQQVKNQIIIFSILNVAIIPRSAGEGG